MSGLITITGLVLIVASFGFCDEKPMVTVYYESLCTDSIRFVTKQLYPSYTSPLKDYYHLKMVPYGKSKLESGTDPSTWKFTCHHGERECYGNKVHGCALEKVSDMGASLRFIVCLMKKVLEDKTAPFPVEECANVNNVNARDIIQCANYTEGVEVLKRNQEETDRFKKPLANVPTISFNGKYDKQVQDMAVDNFAMALCKQLDHPPHECQHMNSAPASAVAAISVSALFLLVPFIL